MKNNQKGFALVELLLVMGIMAILLGIVTISLTRLQRSTNLAATTETLTTDVKSQQLKAMAGQIGSGGIGDQYGIYFNPTPLDAKCVNKTEYVLFYGTYTAGSPTNFPVCLDATITLTPSTNPVIFLQKSGEVSSGAPITITLKNTAGTETTTLTINQYGGIQ